MSYEQIKTLAENWFNPRIEERRTAFSRRVQRKLGEFVARGTALSGVAYAAVEDLAHEEVEQRGRLMLEGYEQSMNAVSGPVDHSVVIEIKRDINSALTTESVQVHKQIQFVRDAVKPARMKDAAELRIRTLQKLGAELDLFHAKLNTDRGVPTFGWKPSFATSSTYRVYEHGDLSAPALLDELIRLLYDEQECNFRYYYPDGDNIDAPLADAIKNRDILVKSSEWRFFRPPDGGKNFVHIPQGQYKWEWQRDVVEKTPEFVQLILELSSRERRELNTIDKVHAEEHYREQLKHAASPEFDRDALARSLAGLDLSTLVSLLRKEFDTDACFVREPELNFLLETPGRSCGLWGELGAGKSDLLKMFRRKVIAQGRIAGYIDLAHSETQDRASFMRRIALALTEHDPGERIDLYSLQDCLEAKFASGGTECSGFALCLDNIDLFCRSLSRLDDSLIILRNLVERYPQIQIVVASRESPYSLGLSDSGASPWYNVFKFITVAELSERRSRQLLAASGMRSASDIRLCLDSTIIRLPLDLLLLGYFLRKSDVSAQHFDSTTLRRYLSQIVSGIRPIVKNAIVRVDGVASESVAKPTTRRVVITLHGIRTRGTWQKKLDEQLADAQFTPRSLDYGSFGVLAFFSERQRNKTVRWFIEEYGRLLEKYPETIPSVIAHSFGTYIVARAIAESAGLVKFDKVIFCGSIVPVEFQWSEVVKEGLVNEVLNDFGHLDIWAGRVGLAIPDAGPSGREGFADLAGGKVNQRLHPEWGHSHYFFDLNYKNRWIKFLNGLPFRDVSLKRHRHFPAGWLLVIFLCLAFAILAGYAGFKAYFRSDKTKHPSSQWDVMPTPRPAITPASSAYVSPADVLTPNGQPYRNAIQEAQFILKELGYDIRFPDGFEGPQTTELFEKFQRESNIPVTGAADLVTLELLRQRLKKHKSF